VGQQVAGQVQELAGMGGVVRVQFTVHNTLPPQKAGGSSMWGKRSQAIRLVKLRRAARDAFVDQAPFQGPVSLVLTVVLRTQSFRVGSGDLDAYLGGVFDGLKGATRTTRLASLLAELASDDDPHLPIAFLDDAQVVQIVAEKRAGGDHGPWYQVIIESAGD
jgi:hypothetical protein